MEAFFEVSKEDRGNYLLNLMQSCGCSYICLWAYIPRLNCLHFKDGYYNEESVASERASSSLGSPARRCFDEFKESVFTIEDDQDSHVPGLAFKQRNPCLQLHESGLPRFVANESQRQFYQEASIKIAIFMGCDGGEIELGMSYLPQMDMEMKLKNLFPRVFSGQQNRPLTSPFIADSTPNQSSSLMFPQPHHNKSTPITSTQPTLTNTPPIPALNQLSRPSTLEMRQMMSAFRRYNGTQANNTGQMRVGLKKHAMFKRAILYMRWLNNHRRRPPSINQLRHSISEKKRREKMNENFQALWSVLPRGTKAELDELDYMPKHKATVLRTAVEYLSSLKSQLEGLSQRNVEPRSSEITSKQQVEAPTAYEERVNVRIIPVSESTSSGGGRMVDLQVRLRRQANSASDMIIRVLEFLNQVREVSLVSMEAQTHHDHQQPSQEAANQNPSNWVKFRLKIEGADEWDESAFAEAVRRVLADWLNDSPQIERL